MEGKNIARMQEESSIPLLNQAKDVETEEDEESSKSKEYKNEKVYKRRWFILFIFSMNTMVNAILFMGLSPIANVAAKHYNQSEVVIEWLSNSFLLFYVLFALPACYLMFKYGVRAVLTTTSSFNALGTIFHYFGYERKMFWCVSIGQVFGAFAFSTVIQIPGQLSAKWFPENERATATAVGVFMNIFGVAVGFLQPTLIVKDNLDADTVTEEIQTLFVLQLIFAVVVFLLTSFGYRENPPTPPSSITIIPKFSFKEDLKALFEDKNFVFMSQSYGIYYGLMATTMVILNPLVTNVYPNGHGTKIGWMGFTAYMTSILSMFLIGLWLDKFKIHQKVSILLNACSTIVWLIFILVLTQTSSFVAVFIVYGILGAVAIPYFSSGIEQAAEMTYPVPEIISSTVILIIANFYGFLLILVLGYLVDTGHVRVVGYIMFFFYILATFFSCLPTTELKRQHAEEEASGENSEEIDEE